MVIVPRSEDKRKKKAEQSGVKNNKDGSCHCDMDPMDFVHDDNEKNKPG